METEQTGTDLLATIETDFVRASTGKRFLNYIIDLLVFYFLMFILGVVMVIVSPGLKEGFSDNNFGLLSRVVALGLYAVYMSIVEAIFKGKSLGKLITKTCAVNLDGSTISTQTAFARGFSRAVPFCAFSALGTPCNPWQDKWTDTMVVDEKESGQY
ncbi:MAG TPA: RDD family protein [Ferruginibacter sp.]|nr:RDD family protein [Ferruginibacter sp.]